MRTIETKVYEFDELTEEQKEKTTEKLWDVNVNYEWWESVYDDAERIGLKISEFDIGRGSYCKGRFMRSAEEVAGAILADHGPDCETVETANQYLIELESLRDPYSDENKKNDEFDPEDIDTEEIDAEFLRMLLEDYRIILSHDYDYLTSREAIVETIRANEYEFDENGNIA